ncbi:Asp-tRNA(Asn)/Glu-tRNA(Gln) amidotransferase subunit GatB [Sphingomonas sp. CGMCC 1.13654]|uniref:Aspartyl/glutamyl-tRNA(Asn/Gln) amidotransferase subunit B n=1 Tax=Sphingomonas chungangi TaxID=2683589 RepID=A0A838LBU5_9SPHN|nr:Asp-tRNA(Asn)/Glu-tRNA(Gln) amidotransferase subunit GatB [Sphingomonas chungangi]MBA2936497.1 Asp-tRNA(Asn)/Glu-tRNA(Gln) amidotransferase subunit GatB [Sphingomonas chungangi]MVW55882.1 Asp-tRNA(Asn)/Glu-tRNA(Gln) amidotransferase subunit GatB [Sphingomonas chungangi]
MTESTYRIQGGTGEWEVVIGLEVHAQVTSQSKLFSGAATAFGAEPNSQVSLIDAAMPGMLPVPNAECIRQAVRTGMAINAPINRWSRFDRKNYFYADLPQGYQISQLYHPLVGEGSIEIEPEGAEPKTIGIERIHVEQDAGKLMHDQHPTRSYVDLNRSGVALMEIVSKPDMRSPAEAGAYVKKLRSILRYVGSCDGNMEQGSMRADVNVSVRKPGDPFGTRTETKNVNSIRFVMATIEIEARRQVDLIEDGGTVVQETRLFDPDGNGGKGVTRSMRSKEDAHDYRYFPDPDLLPLELDEAFLEEARASLPELPDAKRKRYEGDLGLTAYNADVLTADVETARWFEAMLAEGAAPKPASNWVTSELFGALNRLGKDIGESPVSPKQAAELNKLVADGTLSGTLAKQVFEVMLETGDDPAKIVEERGLRQTSDTGAIEAEIAKVMDANPDKVAEYRGGKDKLFGFFVGQTMRAMAGKANPAVVNELLKKALDV